MSRGWIIAGIVAVIALAVGLFAGQREAGAHMTASGWTYPSECCAGHMDCHHIPRSAVTITPDGYHVRLRAGMHHRYYKDADYLFKYKTTQIKIAGDEDWHLCLGGGVPNNGGPPSEYIWRCLYTRPEGTS